MQQEKDQAMVKPKKDTNLTRTPVSLDLQDYEKIEKLTRNSGLAMTFLIRRSMREFIERYGDGGSVSFELKGGK